jgi:hypothetical protein
MSPSSQAEVVAARKRFEAEMEGEIDSLEATRSRSFRTIGVTQAPHGSIVGKRTAQAKRNYRKTKVWGRFARIELKVE